MNFDPESIEAEFQSMIKDLPDPVVEDATLNLLDVNEAVISLTDAASFLARFISRYIEDNETIFPAEAIALTREVRELSDNLCAIMDEIQEDCDCDECRLEEDDDEDDT